MVQVYPHDLILALSSEVLIISTVSAIMGSPNLLNLPPELKVQIFQCCDVDALVRVSGTCKTGHGDVSEELKLRRMWDSVKISRDCGLGPDSRPGLEAHYDHNDCRCRKQHPIPMMHELLIHPHVSRCVTRLRIEEYGLSRVDEDMHDHGIPDEDQDVTSNFLDLEASQLKSRLKQFDRRSFKENWADLKRIHYEETTILMILLYFLPKLESLTLWPTQRWGSELLICFEGALRRLLSAGQLQNTLFGNLTQVTIGNPEVDLNQAISTFYLLALFAALPTMRYIKGHEVEAERANANQHSWNHLKGLHSSVTTLELHSPFVTVDELKVCLESLPMLRTFVFRVIPGDYGNNLARFMHDISFSVLKHLEHLTLSYTDGHPVDGQDFGPGNIASSNPFLKDLRLKSLNINVAMFWTFGRRWQKEKHVLDYTYEEMSLLRAAPKRLDKVISRYTEELIMEGDISPAEVSTLVWDIEVARKRIPRLHTIRVMEVNIDRLGAVQEMEFCVAICSRAGIELKWTEVDADKKLSLEDIDLG